MFDRFRRFFGKPEETKPQVWLPLNERQRVVLGAQIRRDKTPNTFTPESAQTTVQTFVHPWIDQTIQVLLKNPELVSDLAAARAALEDGDSQTARTTGSDVVIRVGEKMLEFALDVEVSPADEDVVIWHDCAWGLLFVATALGGADDESGTYRKYTDLLASDPTGFSTIEAMIHDEESGAFDGGIFQNSTELMSHEFTMAGMEAARQIYTAVYRAI